MAEWDQLRRALGGQDAGGARGAEHVALGGVAAPHGAQGRRLHLDDRASDGLAGGLWLGGHVDHAGVTTSGDRKSTRLNSSHGYISYAVFCLKKKQVRRT